MSNTPSCRPRWPQLFSVVLERERCMRTLKPGVRLRSAVCATEVMVLRAPATEVEVRCGGVEMLALTEPALAEARLDPAHAQGTLIGKRYIDAQDRVEMLCTQGGQGSLTF